MRLVPFLELAPGRRELPLCRRLGAFPFLHGRRGAAGHGHPQWRRSVSAAVAPSTILLHSPTDNSPSVGESRNARFVLPHKSLAQPFSLTSLRCWNKVTFRFSDFPPADFSRF